LTDAAASGAAVVCANSEFAPCLLSPAAFKPTQLGHAAIGRKEIQLGKASQKPVTAL
jgi:hypothetical protein